MTRDEAATLLTGRGVLPTAQRVDIALLTLARPQHLSAEQGLMKAAIRDNDPVFFMENTRLYGN
jgi:pyruvate/2-oxoglutarate/acetoin dehydrogenase E1 component